MIRNAREEQKRARRALEHRKPANRFQHHSLSNSSMQPMAVCFKNWMCLRVIRPFGVALAHRQWWRRLLRRKLDVRRRCFDSSNWTQRRISGWRRVRHILWEWWRRLLRRWWMDGLKMNSWRHDCGRWFETCRSWRQISGWRRARLFWLPAENSVSGCDRHRVRGVIRDYSSSHSDASVKN